MIKDVPGAQHDKSPARHAAKELQQPAIARAVDAGRARDGHRQARALRRFARDALPFDLRHLINIAGPQRRVLVRRRMLDVAVHADRAAMHDPAHAGAAAASMRSPTAVALIARYVAFEMPACR